MVGGLVTRAVHDIEITSNPYLKSSTTQRQTCSMRFSSYPRYEGESWGRVDVESMGDLKKLRSGWTLSKARHINICGWEHR